MRFKVLVLHAYSAENAGDGLLVQETMSLIRSAYPDAIVTMLAARPETFADIDAAIHTSTPTLRGWDKRARETLRNIDRYDLVVAVGGGYLRAGTFVEAIKTALVHGPQLLAAAKTRAPTLYLPQSVGPARFGLRRVIRRQLRRLDTVLLRDDRSVEEVGGPTARRWPDLATLAAANPDGRASDVSAIPVVSIRAVRGRVNPRLLELAESLGTYDSYIQSTTGGNDDRAATSKLRPQRVLERSEFMGNGVTPRVVVAVRLHAALMALAAGHYVIHLAYERKGFGAYDDLKLTPWVHNVNSFDPEFVAMQVRSLLTSPERRHEYNESLRAASVRLTAADDELHRLIATAVPTQRMRGAE